ncbi:hypothetical protein [Streptomonospora wellingtoniae]|uniref:Uncharacterized protein n=1 Tax=Streptomonospora wellingtoniae TaxID=3075544 RepID=A0ABU2KUW8_9ACTN|nr:hypothetical protein [Streptomonospora sp. DSM 45055]MDT0302962.1 hypothetical protein [Streptomonospora sp. DSM 45055]
MATPTRPDFAARIRDAISQVPADALSAHDDKILSWLAGWDDDVVDGVCSLLRLASIYTNPAPAPRQGLRSAHFSYHVAAPAGVDARASEGLPSYMAVGENPQDGPFWHCRRHCHTHHGLVDVALERRGADDHVATFHGGDAR